MSQAISTDLLKYISDIEEKSSKVPLDGYYHIDDVIEAFNRGEKNGRDEVVEHIRQKLLRDSTQMFLYSTKFVNDIRKDGYEVGGAYVDPFRFKFIVVTLPENTVNEDFINKFYNNVFKIEKKFKEETNSNMHISFISNNNINEDELFIDGYLKISGSGE
ncbi:hypothetical protein GCM10023210_21840 [Chryseobacterium ginsengisoli]|uniref:Uncharacterized protein n=1 Tax=Chryseobacterium ginsengisoli TaxID=363853 RepID=A0ABP9MBU5_9FLAO